MSTQEKLHNSEAINVAQDRADELFRVHPGADAAQPQAPDTQPTADASRSALESAEKKPIGDTTAGKAAIAGATGINPVIGGAVRLLGKIKTRRGSATAAIVTVMIALVVGGSFLAGSLAPIAFMRNVVNDLNDQLATLDIRKEKLMRTKITNKLNDSYLKGCGNVLTIRCRLVSISSRDVERLGRAQPQPIEVKGGRKIGTRIYSPEAYIVGGNEYNAAQLADAFKNDASLRQSFKSALNNRFFGFADKGYQWVKEKLGISKLKAKLTGTTSDERAANLAEGDKSSVIPRDATFTQVTQDGPDGKPTTYYQLDQNPSVRLTEAQHNAWQTKSGPLRDFFKSPSGSNVLKAVSIVGALDIGCTAVNMLGMASVASKAGKAVELARYASPILASITAIVAGDGTVEDGEAVGRFFNDPDNRKQVSDVMQTVNENNYSENGALVDNPYYGKSAMDSQLYHVSAMGGDYAPTPGNLLYALSVPATMAAGAFGLIADFIYSLPGAKTGCEIIQNGAVRLAGFVVGIIAMFFGVGEANLTSNVALMAGVMAIMYTAGAVLMNLADGRVVSDDIAQKPEEKAAAMWTGTSVILATTAQYRGLVPASKKNIQAYQVAARQSRQDYLAIDARSTPWYDTRNPSSLLSRIALAINPTTQSQPVTLASILGVSRNVIGRSINTAFSSGDVYAADNTNRFDVCNSDKSYQALGVSPDMQCNLRFYASQEALDKDPMAVADYMENNGYVPANTTSGLPLNYTPPSPQESSNIAMQFLNGAVSQFVDTRLGNVPQGNQRTYAFFLEYCRFRSMPWGETYEESGAAGGADGDWKSGKNCLPDSWVARGQPQMADVINTFIAYSADLSADEITETPPPPTTTTGTTPAPTPPAATGEWHWPLDKTYYDQNRAGWLKSHYLSGNFLGNFPASLDLSFIGILDKPVFAMLGGKVIKEPLGRASYICTGRPNSPNNGGLTIRSTYQGMTVDIAYAHGDSVAFPLGADVPAGAQIMNVGLVGNTCGPHVHMDIAANGKSICPQDVFLVMESGATPDLNQLIAKATPGCAGRQ